MAKLLVVAAALCGAAAFAPPRAGVALVRMRAAAIAETSTAEEPAATKPMEPPVAEVITPAQAVEDEKTTVTKPIGGVVGVSGLFVDTPASDQFALDCLHAQGWEGIRLFGEDVKAMKKRLISRSARYSGLLDALSYADEPAPSVASLEGCKAWLAFGVAPGDVAATLEAAEASSVERVVVVATGPVDASTLTKAAASSLVYSVFGVDAELDLSPEGGAVGFDCARNASLGPISRQDVYRVVAEAFVCSTAVGKSLSLTNGGETVAAYYKMLREAGYTRRGELAKVMGGGLASFEKSRDAVADYERRKEAGEFKPTAGQLAVQAAQTNAKYAANRIKENQKKIFDYTVNELGREWMKKQYTTNANTSQDRYIEKNWERGCADACNFLKITGASIPPNPDSPGTITKKYEAKKGILSQDTEYFADDD